MCFQIQRAPSFPRRRPLLFQYHPSSLTSEFGLECWKKYGANPLDAGRRLSLGFRWDTRPRIVAESYGTCDRPTVGYVIELSEYRWPGPGLQAPRQPPRGRAHVTAGCSLFADPTRPPVGAVVGAPMGCRSTKPPDRAAPSRSRTPAENRTCRQPRERCRARCAARASAAA